jgi:hypothetical protein
MLVLLTLSMSLGRLCGLERQEGGIPYFLCKMKHPSIGKVEVAFRVCLSRWPSHRI